MVRVLFVCLGNICRSPMAEGVFQHLVDSAQLGDRIEVDSAGTGPWHVGDPAHRGTRKVLRDHGITYDGRGRRLTPDDFEAFDYILAMDYDNLSVLNHMKNGTSAYVGLFMNFASDGSVEEVPDPYYNGRFDLVYSLVEQAAQGLLAHIREEHNL